MNLGLFFSGGALPLIIIVIALFQKIEWRKEIKRQARTYFYEGAWLKFALCLVISVVGVIVLSALLGVFIPFLSVSCSVFGMGVVSYGTIEVMRLIRNHQEFGLRDFISIDNVGGAVSVYFIKWLYTFFWSLLLVIPGMIKSYSYSQAMFIISEDPAIGADGAITRSREMMNGHKWELVILQSSFFGWAILGALTFGIAIIYILPLYAMSMAVFYEYVKRDYFAAKA